MSNKPILPTYYVAHPDGSFSVADPQPEPQVHEDPELLQLAREARQRAECRSGEDVHQWAEKLVQSVHEPQAPAFIMDAVVEGTGMLLNGERIDPASIYKEPQAQAAEPDYKNTARHWHEVADRQAEAISKKDAALKACVGALKNSDEGLRDDVYQAIIQGEGAL